MTRAYYSASSKELVAATLESIVGSLALQSPFEVNPAQRDAWVLQIRQLQGLARLIPDSHFFLEFSIPRMGRRADVVIVWRGVVYVVEYKVGATGYAGTALDQVLGYALDLKNFHETSHDLSIVPVLVATGAMARPVRVSWYEDRVAAPVSATPATLMDVMSAFTQAGAPTIDPSAWEAGRYKPTPTIIEAAQALYRNHSVEDITRNEAGAENLSVTAAYVGGVIEQSKARRRKAICLVTGVPGSGKTLAGLNVANQRMYGHDDEHAVFLSGNGPLVIVLREALTQDALARAKKVGQRPTRSCELSRASAFIQNIHHFRDEALKSAEPVIEKVVVFDEAQRAWNVEQTSKFMREKRQQFDFSQSEPDFLLGVMDRHRDWCVVICLVGGGQEINTGEAGLVEWLEVLSTKYSAWDVYLPSQALGPEYLPKGAADRLDAYRRATVSTALHLAVSIRSFRAEKLSQFVGALIDDRPEDAKSLIADLGKYPVTVTRDLGAARAWLRHHRRGEERAGLLASSNALRLKPDGVFVRAKIDPAVWFLAPREDVRSSDALEDAAREFEVQGLELDWACVCWDANMRRGKSGWETLRFSGTRWQRVKEPARRSFLLNSYRVLLTRARQGMVIFVPRGDSNDATRSPAVYDAIATFLKDCGVSSL
jgi:hypothetical protein